MERLQDIIFYQLETAIKSYRQLAQRNINAAGIDLTIDQWLVMKAILEHGEISQNEIAARVFKDAASVTRIITLLIQKGYLTSDINNKDLRRSVLKTTRKGTTVLEKVQAVIKQNRDLSLNGLGEKEIKGMHRSLATIITNCKNA